MIHQSKGKIFLADQRGVNETECFQRRYTFNFGEYFNEHKHAFGDLYILNDESLAGGRSITIMAASCSHLILLPVAGAITYKDAAGNNSFIAAGQVQVSTVNKGTAIEINNPFREELVNFLQVWIRADKTKEQNSLLLSTYADVNENENSLVPGFPENPDTNMLPFAIYIGKFSGRGETAYRPENKSKGIFIFVLEGAFEVDGRLLHARDGLALWQTSEVEMEALSNDAIITVIELPYSSQD